MVAVAPPPPVVLAGATASAGKAAAATAAAKLSSANAAAAAVAAQTAANTAANQAASAQVLLGGPPTTATAVVQAVAPGGAAAAGKGGGAPVKPKVAFAAQPTQGTALFAASAKESALRASAVAVYEDASVKIDDFFVAVRVMEHMINLEGIAGTMQTENCCKRALRHAHDDCRPHQQSGKACDKCSVFQHDARLDVMAKLIVARCGPAVLAQL